MAEFIETELQFEQRCPEDFCFFDLTVEEWECLRVSEVGNDVCDIYQRIPRRPNEFWEIFSARTLFSLMSGTDPQVCSGLLEITGYSFVQGEENMLQRIDALDFILVEELVRFLRDKVIGLPRGSLEMMSPSEKEQSMIDALVRCGSQYPVGSDLSNLWVERHIRVQFFHSFFVLENGLKSVCYKIEGSPFFERKDFVVCTTQGTVWERAREVVSQFEKWWLSQEQKRLLSRSLKDVPSTWEVINYGDDVKVIVPPAEKKEMVPCMVTNFLPSPPLRALTRAKLCHGVKNKSWLILPPKFVCGTSRQERDEWQDKHFYHEQVMWDRISQNGMMLPRCRPYNGLLWWCTLPHSFAPFRYYSHDQYLIVLNEVSCCVAYLYNLDLVSLLEEVIDLEMAKLERPVVSSVLPLERYRLMRDDVEGLEHFRTSSIVPESGLSAAEWTRGRLLTIGHFPLLIYQRAEKSLYYREGVLITGQAVTVVSPRTGNMRIVISTLVPTLSHQHFCSMVGKPWIKISGGAACPDVPLANVFIPPKCDAWAFSPDKGTYRTLYWITVVHERTGHWATRPVIFVRNVFNGRAMEDFPNIPDQLKGMGLDRASTEFCSVGAPTAQFTFVNGVKVDHEWLCVHYGLLPQENVFSER